MVGTDAGKWSASAILSRLLRTLGGRRAARQAAEDAEDLALARESLDEGGEPIPWERAKQDLGVR